MFNTHHQSIYIQEAGIIMAIHQYNATPFPEQDGMSIWPGQSSNVGIAAKCVSSLIVALNRVI